ncbi:hypothetical protein A9237_26415 [Vibrio owensii]|nr:hypothetical protein A9237_26415 [Vibrio owensii]
MMTRNFSILSLIAFLFLGLKSEPTHAFSCSFGSFGLRNVDVNLSSLSNIGDYEVVSDFSKHTCTGGGAAHHLDYLRIDAARNEAILNGTGLQMMYRYGGVDYTAEEALYRCIWPITGSVCPLYVYESNKTSPAHGMIIFKRVSAPTSEVNIPPYSNLAFFSFQQHGAYSSTPSWGSNRIQLTIRNIDAVVTPTCSIGVESVDQTVMLPNTQITNFSGVGSTTGSTPFTVELNCDANVTVYAHVTDSNELGNTSDILSLDETSTASGVGIQMLYGNQPISFGVSNQFFVTEETNGTGVDFIIPFDARYIQSSSTITPGTVSAKATISFDYF